MESGPSRVWRRVGTETRGRIHPKKRDVEKLALTNNMAEAGIRTLLVVVIRGRPGPYLNNDPPSSRSLATFVRVYVSARSPVPGTLSVVVENAEKRTLHTKYKYMFFALFPFNLSTNSTSVIYFDISLDDMLLNQ